MSVESCSCTNPKMPLLGRPKCVIRKKKTAFIGIMSRYKADGTENVIDVTSATLGADIRALISASTPELERLYLFPKMEEVDYTRTETAYQTFKSGRKAKLDGEGGVRSFSGMLVGDDAVEAMARQLQRLGCTEIVAFDFTVDGNIWGAMDDVTSGELRGYHVETETIDSFIVRAKDGETNSISFSFDYSEDQDFIDSYAITADELGYRATTLKPLIYATCTAEEATASTMIATVTTDFGSSVNSGKVVGLTSSNFSVTADGVAVTIGSVTETSDGVYTITFTDGDIDTSDVVVVAVTATGYDVTSGTFTSAS